MDPFRFGYRYAFRRRALIKEAHKVLAGAAVLRKDTKDSMLRTAPYTLGKKVSARDSQAPLSRAPGAVTICNYPPPPPLTALFVCRLEAVRRRGRKRVMIG